VPQQLAKDICGLIENTCRRKTCLNLLIDHDKKLWHTLSATTPRKASKVDLYDSLSMKVIIEKLQEERLQGSEFKGNSILSLKQRRIIAVLLSHGLLQFCGSAWLSEHWDKESISFFRYGDDDRIVLSTALQAHEVSPDPDAPFRFHHYPGVLALGVLLLEMELKKTIETARSEQDEPSTDDEEPNLYTDLEIALKMFDDIQDNALPDFKSAVEACLTFDYFKEGTEIDDLIYHRDKLYDDMVLRRKIYQEIVAPLERELCISFPEIKLDGLSQMPLAFSFWNRANLPPRTLHNNQKITHLAPITPTSIPSKHTIKNVKSILTEGTSDSLVQIRNLQPVFFHDVSMPLSKERQVARKEIPPSKVKC
jgi:hypothetical protein